MKKYSTADLRKLEIVNVCDGARLGYARKSVAFFILRRLPD